MVLPDYADGVTQRNKSVLTFFPVLIKHGIGGRDQSKKKKS